MESNAAAVGKWASNIETASCTTTIINKHREKINDEEFIEKLKQKEFDSTFDRVGQLVHWLEGVNDLHKYYIQNPSARGIPEEFSGLIHTNSNSVRLTRFLASEDHKSVGIIEYLDIAHKQLSEIYEKYTMLAPVVRQNLNKKLHNGYNTVLVLNELVIGVMIDV